MDIVVCIIIGPLATGHLMWVVVFCSHIRDIIELVKKVSNCAALWCMCVCVSSVTVLS